jgi:hypothetical protein
LPIDGKTAPPVQNDLIAKWMGGSKGVFLRTYVPKSLERLPRVARFDGPPTSARFNEAVIN